MRHLDDPKVDVGHFTHMGAKWGTSVKELRQLPNGAKINPDLLDYIATAWIHEEQDLCYHLYLKTRLKVYLEQTKSEKTSLTERKQKIIDSLLKSKCIHFRLSVPRSTSIQDSLENSKRKKVDISICFLSSSMLMCVELEPNPEQKAVGQTTTFINNLEKIQAGMEDELKITAVYKRKKKTLPVTLKELQNQKSRKVDYATVDKSLGDRIEVIELSQLVELGRAVFASPTKFITQVETAVTNFVLQIFEA
jgi:hypothetical protein